MLLSQGAEREIGRSEVKRVRVRKGFHGLAYSSTAKTEIARAMLEGEGAKTDNQLHLLGVTDNQRE